MIGAARQNGSTFLGTITRDHQPEAGDMRLEKSECLTKRFGQNTQQFIVEN